MIPLNCHRLLLCLLLVYISSYNFSEAFSLRSLRVRRAIQLDTSLYVNPTPYSFEKEDILKLLQAYNQFKPILPDIKSILPSFLKRSVVSTPALDTVVKKNYFSRRLEQENQIRSIFQRTEDNGQYFVVYGAKGVGKSLLVDHATKGNSGIIKVKVTSITTIDDIVKSLAKQCGI
jgi:hypothetical protein